MRQSVLLDELVAFAGGEAQRVAVALQVEEQLGAVLVLPFAGIHRAAAQPDDQGQMLNTHRTLELARSAGRALESRFLRDVLAQQRCLDRRSVLVQVTAQAQRDLLRVQDLAGVARRAMFGAAAAFHAGVGLQAVSRVTSLPVTRPKSSSPKRRNAAEALPARERR